MARKKRLRSAEETAYEQACRQWNGKPYYSLDCYLKQQFGQKIYKVAIDGGMTCPNRDGTKGTRGCSFCSAGGSGEFAVSRTISEKSGIPTALNTGCSDEAAVCQTFHTDRSHEAAFYRNTPDPERIRRGIVTRQLDEGISHLKTGHKYCGDNYIAYFQSYSNTYAPVPYLRALYTEAIAHPETAALSIATRPDCFSPEIYDLLSECQSQKPVWIELGLQTMHDVTAHAIGRGYPLSCFEAAVRELQDRNIPVIVHVILGLPGEDHARILETIRYLNQLGISGIKLQLLHILKGTTMAEDFQKGRLTPLTKDEYIAILLDCIAHLSPDIVIHRITGDGPADLLLAPTWSLNKREILNTIAHQMKTQHLYQGCRLNNEGR